MLQTVRSSLAESTAAGVAPSAATSDEAAPEQYYYTEETYVEERWGHDANDVVFDDTGEGAGTEGDLDVDDE